MSTIIIAAIIVFSSIGICMLFIFISKKDEQKKNKKLLALHSKAGSAHGLSFSSQEILKDKIIGLDGLNQTLLIFEFTNANNVICINIPEVKNCITEKKYDSIMIGNDGKSKLEPHLRSIDIKFSFKNNREPVPVSFYDSNVNNIYEMAELESKAKNWEVLLSRMISKELKATA